MSLAIVLGVATGQPSQCFEAIVEQHTHFARHVIVASACGAEATGRAGHELVVRAAGEDTQPFKRTGHIGPFQTVEAMLPLHQHFHQVRCLQSIQVYARS